MTKEYFKDFRQLDNLSLAEGIQIQENRQTQFEYVCTWDIFQY